MSFVTQRPEISAPPLGSRNISTLAAWKGLTRVNHVVTGVRAASWGHLSLHSVS